MIDSAAHTYADLVRSKLGSHLIKLVLFGSRARDDAHPGSDYDFLAVVDKKSSDIESFIIDSEVELMDRYDVLAGTIIYDQNEWKRASQFPIGRNIQKDGVDL